MDSNNYAFSLIIGFRLLHLIRPYIPSNGICVEKHYFPHSDCDLYAQNLFEINLKKKKFAVLL